MEISSLWEQVTGQGAMFYAATGSIGLGATMVLIAGIAQIKRIRHRSAVTTEPTPARKAEEIEIHPEMVLDTYNSLESMNQRGNPRPALKGTEMQELTELLGRLKSVAQKLEESRLENGPRQDVTADSTLKEAGSGVDYVFRAGTG